LLTGIIIIGKSVINIFNPIAIHQLNIGALIAGVAGFANYFLGRYLIRMGERHHSITLIADGKHLISDTMSSIGLVAAVIVMYYTNWLWLDNLFAILFGIVIIYTGYRLIRKSLAGLMDEANETILKEMVDILNTNRHTNWIDIHNLRILQYGSSYHIDCHITLPWYHDLQTSHEELKKVETLMMKKFHHKVELFIHPDPCLPFSCSICQITDCKVRQNPFTQKVEWTLDNVMLNQKHHL
jgi:cation diffusion facilitator family transporter